jgi:hypothetical protein
MLLFVLQLSWCVLLYVPCEAWLLALYDYDDLLIISILRYFSRSSEVLLNSQVCITFIYILLPTFNSDELVMSRENLKNFNYAFCKSRALHFYILSSSWLILWLLWVDRIYISFYILFSSWLSWVDRIYISFYISLSSWLILWLSWVDRIYIFFYIPLSSWLILWLSWVDRIYISFYIPLSSWLILWLSWVDRIYSYVLMKYFKTFKFIFGGIGHITSSSNHEPRF